MHPDAAPRETAGIGVARNARPDIGFARLAGIPVGGAGRALSDPCLVKHMLLLTEACDRGVAERFAAAKKACWLGDGLGQREILADRCHVGWRGYQKERGARNVGLSLRPDALRLGAAITRRALAFARADPHNLFVTFVLPRWRRNCALKHVKGREGVVVPLRS